MGKTKKKYYHYYDNDKPLFPLTIKNYVKIGNRWVLESKEFSTISRKEVGYVLDKRGISSRRYTTDHSTSEPCDTFSSISPNRKSKSEWFVDFKKGNEKYLKLADKSYMRKRYYQKYGK